MRTPPVGGVLQQTWVFNPLFPAGDMSRQGRIAGDPTGLLTGGLPPSRPEQAEESKMRYAILALLALAVLPWATSARTESMKVRVKCLQAQHELRLEAISRGEDPREAMRHSTPCGSTGVEK